MDDVVALPGMAIAAKREVRSLLVVSKKPIEHARSGSRSTRVREARSALVRILRRGALENRP